MGMSSIFKSRRLPVAPPAPPTAHIHGYPGPGGNVASSDLIYYHVVGGDFQGISSTVGVPVESALGDLGVLRDSGYRFEIGSVEPSEAFRGSLVEEAVHDSLVEVSKATRTLLETYGISETPQEKTVSISPQPGSRRVSILAPNVV